jgi:hypothetical protein
MEEALRNNKDEAPKKWRKVKVIGAFVLYCFNPHAHMKRDSALRMGFNTPPLCGWGFFIKRAG